MLLSIHVGLLGGFHLLFMLINALKYLFITIRLLALMSSLRVQYFGLYSVLFSNLFLRRSGVLLL